MLVLMLPVFLWGMSYGERQKTYEIVQALARGKTLNLPGIKVEVDRIDLPQVARTYQNGTCEGCHAQ
jgi:hypothetical protein